MQTLRCALETAAHMACPPEGGPLGSGEKQKGQLRMLRAGQPHLGKDPPRPRLTHHSWSSSPSTMITSPSENVSSSGLSATQLYRALTRLGFSLVCVKKGAQGSVCGETRLLRGQPGHFASNGSPGPASLQACAPTRVNLGRLSAAWGRGTSWRRPTQGREWQSGAWCADRGWS